MRLKNGYSLVYGDFLADHPTCGGGDWRHVSIIDTSTGSTVWRSITCPCGRGCGNKACVRDDWGYHDTDIEQYREDHVVLL